MDLILFFVLPAAVAAGSAMICYVLMQARMELAVAREKGERAHIEARLEMVEEMLPERLQAAEESAQRRAFDQLMGGFRVEERRYVRDGEDALPSLVLQERLYFRNVPLSNWIEHELPNSALAAETTSVFTNPSKLLELAMFPEPQSVGAGVVEPPAPSSVPAIRARGPQLIRRRSRAAAV
jgi:hypothetical protein